MTQRKTEIHWTPTAGGFRQTQSAMGALALGECVSKRGVVRHAFMATRTGQVFVKLRISFAAKRRHAAWLAQRVTP